MQIRPDEDFPVNRGRLCQKGWTAPELLSTSDRPRSPLVDGRPTSWDDALDHVTERLQRIQAESGPDAVAVFGGGGLTDEKAYALGKFARAALGASCNSVTKKHLVAAWRDGARAVPALAEATWVSTGCGCSEAVGQLCSWLGSAEPEKEGAA